jgi:signal transduction histidine kinase
MTSMSSDMLKYVKEWVPKSVRVDLTQTLTKVYNVIWKTAKDKGVEIRLDITPKLPSVVCDKSMIHSTVMDIVSNALDACLWKDYGDGETPEIALRAYSNRDHKELIIEVKDNGCGMTEDVKANIFTPFFSTKSKAGTGLGLSLSSRMINVHGGRIDVESESNHGATFRIVLPVDGTDRNKEYTDGKESPGC